MAPEQTEGENVDHRIDIFAAGIVLHEVLTGRRLFKGQNDLQTIERVRSCQVRPPSASNPACPPLLDAILLKALAREPDDRFQTADEMADALDEVVHDAHFTPQQLALALRQAFNLEGGAGGAAHGAAASSRPSSSLSNSAISVTSSSVTSSSSRRSPTVPPISISSPRPAVPITGSFDEGTVDVDQAALGGIMPRPVWKRGSFWLVALLCAGGVTLGIVRGVRVDGRPAAAIGPESPEHAAPTSEIPRESRRKVKPVPILIQSDPEGADIYVAGRLESLGTTPRWINLELDPGTPARVMVRKAGFRDRAFAVETERPPLVTLIPIGAPDAVPAPTQLAAPRGGGLPPTNLAAGNSPPGSTAPGASGAKFAPKFEPRIVHLRTVPKAPVRKVKSRDEDSTASPTVPEEQAEQAPREPLPNVEPLP